MGEKEKFSLEPSEKEGKNTGTLSSTKEDCAAIQNEAVL
jgi:hypothetical protein